MTQPSGSGTPEGLVEFRVLKSDVQIRTKFRTHLWTLFHNIPALYSALLSELGDFGVTPQSIRSDVGDGSLGAYNVNFWMYGFRAQVRIRLEQLEIDFNNVSPDDWEGFEKAYLRLTTALTTASKDLGYASHLVDLGLHGELAGMTTAEYLATFTNAKNVPQLTGTFKGSASVFYFVEDGAVSFRSMGVDLSGKLADNLYVRLYVNFEDAIQPPALLGAMEKELSRGLTALGLRT